ncbi:helix-turn-helix domain-containing protein [Glycomyces sp. A-F 0318]|uniref:helix-turn-helix domain-containing protein n=1 Tax=Glycomyces amatae TaxID=2881355 RepID=UPI001E4B5DD7|nr:helix-turn-helix domain-containing protein [Glycomyces amatae]MCD0447193.1 helix-turn-helix domain-containing protein [Glycomyces amatae]
MTPGQQLRTARTAVDLSLGDMARRLPWSKAALGFYETDQRPVPNEVITAYREVVAQERHRLAEEDVIRRRALLSLGVSSIPGFLAVDSGPTAAPQRIGAGDVSAVKDMIALFSRVDQRRGGGHARNALAQYLKTDVSDALAGTFRNEAVRQQLFSAAGEASYLVGWMAFDDGRHQEAQQAFALAVELSSEARDAPLSGHVLRAMAHQANDLGQTTNAVNFSAASITGPSIELATPRERALLRVVRARTLVSTGEHRTAAQVLLQAEDDLASADPGIEEPDRVFFFGEASLAHETACALRDMGDLDGAAREFERSVEARRAETFARTHAVTLGYLAEVLAQRGELESACDAWSRALDAMNGIRSGRTRSVVKTLITTLDSHRGADVEAAVELRARAEDLLLASG